MAATTLYLKWSVGDVVTIKGLDMPGTIQGFEAEGYNLYYRVTYWLDGKLERVMLCDWEIE